MKNDKNYTELYVEIFKHAKKDSMSKVKELIYDELHNRCIEKKEIHRYIATIAENIRHDVKEMVYREAQTWPHTNKAQTIAKEYNLRNKYVKMYFDEVREKVI